MDLLREVPQVRRTRSRAAPWVVPISMRAVPQALALLDVASIVTLSIACGLATNVASIGRGGDISSYFGFGIAVAALFSTTAHGCGLYSRSHLEQVRFQIHEVGFIWTMVFFFLAVVGLTLKINDVVPLGAVVLLFVTGLGGIVLLRRHAQRMLVFLSRSGALARRQVIVVAHSGRPICKSVIQAVEGDGGNICETILLPTAPSDGMLSEHMRVLIDHVRRRSVDEILLATSWADTALIENISAYLRVVPVPVRLVPDPTVGALLERPLVDLGGTRAIELQAAPLSRPQLTAKRSLDLVLTVLALPFLLPALAIIAGLIALESPGPVLFRQHRIGFNGLLFQIYKFRTMKTLEDGEVVQQACQDDARVTRVGRVLRRFSLDELPQVFNVLKGEMSLVGPRPHALAHDNEYGRLIALYAARHNVKPGITGWAQVNGWRGPTPQVQMMTRRVEFDLWYVDHWSLWLDIKILILTALSVCGGKNAY
jgi:Undecaprenyl-phosphate glucose phosphotransferase